MISVGKRSSIFLDRNEILSSDSLDRMNTNSLVKNNTAIITFNSLCKVVGSNTQH